MASHPITVTLLTFIAFVVMIRIFQFISLVGKIESLFVDSLHPPKIYLEKKS